MHSKVEIRSDPLQCKQPSLSGTCGKLPSRPRAYFPSSIQLVCLLIAVSCIADRNHGRVTRMVCYAIRAPPTEEQAHWERAYFIMSGHQARRGVTKPLGLCRASRSGLGTCPQEQVTCGLSDSEIDAVRRMASTILFW